MALGLALPGGCDDTPPSPTSAGSGATMARDDAMPPITDPQLGAVTVVRFTGASARFAAGVRLSPDMAVSLARGERLVIARDGVNQVLVGPGVFTFHRSLAGSQPSALARAPSMPARHLAHPLRRVDAQPGDALAPPVPTATSDPIEQPRPPPPGRPQGEPIRTVPPPMPDQ